MTDKVHPIIEAMARAICLADHVDPDSCDNNVADAVFMPNWTAYIENAKAAAKVLLSAPPNGHMIQAAVQTLHDDLEPTDQELTEIYTAMTAAARSDMGV